MIPAKHGGRGWKESGRDRTSLRKRSIVNREMFREICVSETSGVS